MCNTEFAVNSKTPSVKILDNRGLTARDIAYHRRPDAPEVTSVRITRHQYDARGFLIQSTDPRLSEVGRANFTYLKDLSGSVLRAVSTDAGTTVALNDAAGRLFIAVSNISTVDDGTEDRSQAVTRTWQYEDAALQGRPVSITEQLNGEAARITERFMYAGNAAEEKVLNLAGTCVSHYDTAGLMQTGSVALTGVPLAVTRRLLKDADNPAAGTDWQGEDVSAWNTLLAEEGEGHTTLTTVDATSAALTITDAKGNRQRVAYDVAGLLSGSWLTLKGGIEQIIVASLTYSAAGQKLREVHGNGVVTTYTYEAETQRLIRIKTERPAGHPSGARVLQDLRYEYDPVGNVLKINNDAEETRFWRNQKVVPENTYIYDSLYQLVSATGREMAGAGQQSSHLPSATVPHPTDSAAYTKYTRTYHYDKAGNLTQVRHTPATGSGYTTRIIISDRSNRGVLSTLTENPADVDALFTAGGQQKQLQPGQSLLWTPRNELLKVTPVVRDDSADDRESYRYDSGSQRVLKVSVQKTGAGTQTQRVLYLPGLELRSTHNGYTETEGLEVITAGEAGRAQVRVLHWITGRPDEMTGDQLRYSYDNLTASSGLELDGDGRVISTEEYYPYGGTAILTARSRTEVKYKTVRYSGKERDTTGLYYYGYRYYQPWSGRWLSADPAGRVDGLNLFRFCRNNPVTLKDEDGLSPDRHEPLIIHIFYHGEIPNHIYDNILNTINKNPRNQVKLWSDDRASKHFINLTGEFKNLEVIDWNELKNIKSKEGDESFGNISGIFSKIEASETKGKEKSLSDLSRLLALYEYGGLYLDADVVIKEEFSVGELFGSSDFRTHLSIENSIVNVDFYDAIGIKNPHDTHLNEVLKSLHADYEDGYLEAASSPGELVRIKDLVRLKLNEALTGDDIDNVLSEDVIPAHDLDKIMSTINNIDILKTLKGKISFSPMRSV
ncbi:RHS repeat-associated core domain-containing protein [Kalamiella sp. sgz302252]|uniref:RHS repeat-associated core domain-containing protein n=1 Tax=Pantoea sp. sgz302252 TaxID=3341827 RepID=UPI0036D2B841